MEDALPLMGSPEQDASPPRLQARPGWVDMSLEQFVALYADEPEGSVLDRVLAHPQARAWVAGDGARHERLRTETLRFYRAWQPPAPAAAPTPTFTPPPPAPTAPPVLRPAARAPPEEAPQDPRLDRLERDLARCLALLEEHAQRIRDLSQELVDERRASRLEREAHAAQIQALSGELKEYHKRMDAVREAQRHLDEIMD